MKPRTATASIANNGTESNAINLYGARQLGFYIPAGLDSVTLKFKASPSKTGTFLPVHDKAGAEISLTVAASRFVTWEVPVSLPWVKLVVAAQTPALDITIIAQE